MIPLGKKITSILLCSLFLSNIPLAAAENTPPPLITAAEVARCLGIPPEQCAKAEKFMAELVAKYRTAKKTSHWSTSKTLLSLLGAAGIVLFLYRWHQRPPRGGGDGVFALVRRRFATTGDTSNLAGSGSGSSGEVYIPEDRVSRSAPSAVHSSSGEWHWPTRPRPAPAAPVRVANQQLLTALQDPREVYAFLHAGAQKRMQNKRGVLTDHSKYLLSLLQPSSDSTRITLRNRIPGLNYDFNNVAIARLVQICSNCSTDKKPYAILSAPQNAVLIDIGDGSHIVGSFCQLYEHLLSLACTDDDKRHAAIAFADALLSTVAVFEHQSDLEAAKQKVLDLLRTGFPFDDSSYTSEYRSQSIELLKSAPLL